MKRLTVLTAVFALTATPAWGFTIPQAQRVADRSMRGFDYRLVDCQITRQRPETVRCQYEYRVMMSDPVPEGQPLGPEHEAWLMADVHVRARHGRLVAH